MSSISSHVGRACLALLPLLLAGCMPNTTADFRSSSPGAVEFVAPVEFQQAYQLVARNTLRCQGGTAGYLAPVGSSFVLVPGGQNKVEGKVHPGGAHATVTVAFASAAESGFLQVIDIESVSKQESRVTVYRLNRSPKWKAAAEAVRGWFDGETRC